MVMIRYCTFTEEFTLITNRAFGPQMATSDQNNNGGSRVEVGTSTLELGRIVETGNGSRACPEDGTNALLAQLLAQMVNKDKDKDRSVGHAEFLKLQPPYFNGNKDPS